MHEPSGSSLGRALGMLALAFGIACTGWGLASALSGDQLNGVDGVLFGGLALVAGCVILRRREAAAKQNHSNDPEQIAPAEQPRH